MAVTDLRVGLFSGVARSPRLFEPALRVVGCNGAEHVQDGAVRWARVPRSQAAQRRVLSLEKFCSMSGMRRLLPPAAPGRGPAAARGLGRICMKLSGARRGDLVTRSVSLGSLPTRHSLHCAAQRAGVIPSPVRDSDRVLGLRGRFTWRNESRDVIFAAGARSSRSLAGWRYPLINHSPQIRRRQPQRADGGSFSPSSLR